MKGSGIPYPYVINDYAGYTTPQGYPYPATFRDTSSKTPAAKPSGRIISLMVFGQSIGSNYATPYAAHNGAKVLNFNPIDQKLYLATGPILGTTNGGAGSGGCYFNRLQDKLVDANKCDVAILTNLSVGGTVIADWGLNGLFNHRVRNGIILHRIALGFDPTHIVMQQGESDDDALGTTTAQWMASFNEFRASVRAVGCQSPIYVPLETYDGAYMLSAQAAKIRAAQAGVVNSVDVFQGPDIDRIPLIQRQVGGGPHLMTDPGPDTAASLWMPFF